MRRFLIESGGVPTAAVHARGYGESQPAAPNNTPLNKARNRRVEAVIPVTRRIVASFRARLASELPRIAVY